MKKTAGFLASLCVVLCLAFGSSVMAETITAAVALSPANEVPPVTGLNATGNFLISFNVTRDVNGVITGGTVNFLGSVAFPSGPVTVTGLHIHQGPAGVNGSIVIESGITPTTPLVLNSGAGLINQTSMSVSAALIQSILSNPAGFYVNLHTSTNPGGVIRSQLVTLNETLATTVAMTPAQETPPITGVTASGMGTITVNPVRKAATGEVTGGTVTFSVQYDLPPGSVISGLHIHEGAVGVAGPVVINTGINGTTNSITTTTGKGSVNIEVPITAATLSVFQRLLANQANFYVNLHTTVYPAGLIRGQLTAFSSPPILQQVDTYFLETGATDATVKLLATGIDLSSSITINGQPVFALPDLTTGILTVTIPGALRTNAGVLSLQARTGSGQLSTPIAIVVAPAANNNTFAVTTTDAARYATTVAPGSIAVAFGTRLASQMLSSTTQPMPTSLDGTTVYVNGIAARLFYVSANQINFLVPTGTATGPASLVIVAKDGTVSRGVINVAPNNPAIFTRKGDGTGAPSAVASADGTNFNIQVSNPDGTAVALDAGNFVSLFGTGFRYGSTSGTGVKVTIGGTDVTPMFVGAQGSLDGLDQINLQIPQSLAGRGDVDLVITVDGKTSNTVKLKIK